MPHTVTLLPTYRCTAACKECCFQSNPWIEKRVPQDRLLTYIDQAATIDTVKLICFSGGEAFLLGDDLVELVERCTHHGLMTRVVSNGYWAVNGAASRRRLLPLVGAGLNEVNFSTGDDHIEYVNLKNICCGLASANDLGLGLALMIEGRAESRVTIDSVLEAAKEYPRLQRAIKSKEFPIIISPWMEFSSNNAVKPERSALVNARNVEFRQPCTSIYTTVVVTPDEKLAMCCGLSREGIPDLHAGCLNRNSIGELVERSAYDFLKIWLFVEGPEKILAWAATKDPTIEWENRYAHNCDACRAMYCDPRVITVIQQHFEEKYHDIVFKFASYGASRPDGGKLLESREPNKPLSPSTDNLGAQIKQ